MTDMSCAFLFIAYMVGMVFVMIYGFADGLPERLTHGVDFAGRVCGVSSGVTTKPMAYWCGSIEREGDYPKFLREDGLTCLESCPADTSTLVECLNEPSHNFTAISPQNYVEDNMQVVEKFSIIITQSVSKQASYPSSEFGGRFCMPQRQDLHDQVIDGVWHVKYRWPEAVGSLRDAWPLLLVCGVIALLCGYLYLYLLGKFAGLIMLMSMIGSAVLMVGFGLFFFWATFESDKGKGSYEDANPLYQIYTEDEARLYSISLGIVCILIALIIGCITQASIRHIDEMVGLVDAARECIMGEDQKDIGYLLWPIIQTGMFLGVMIWFLLIGLPYVLTVGNVSPGEFQINGVDLVGFRHENHKSEWEKVMIVYYICGCLWLWEFSMQLGHMVIAFAVSTWYFTPNTTHELENVTAMQQAIQEAGLGIGKNVKVRCGGADNAFGERVGVIKEVEKAGKVLLIPVGKRGPGVGRNEVSLVKYEKESGRCSVCLGLTTCLLKHLGSVALASIVIGITRPFRMFVQCVQGFLARTDDPGVKGIGFDQPERSQQFRGFCALFSQLLDFFFGKWSKMGLTQLVLNGGADNSGYVKSCSDAFELMVNSGGTLAYLHGALIVYEYFGIFLITLFSTAICFILSGSIPWFTDMDGEWYIEDRTSVCIFCAIISGVISFSCMSLFNNAADVLLFDVTWNRRMHYKNSHENLAVTKYAPAGLRALIGEEELKSSYEEGLGAHAPGQVGALQHALEAGALQTATHGPSYFKSEAGGHGGGAGMGAMSTMGSAVMQQYLWNAH